jgi:hypothetical protein
MARIRSVKPEFWTDPDVVALPMAARLFFIGCWNHADDYGVLKDDPGRLKLQILPSDDVDPAELVDRLVTSGHLLRRVDAKGTPLLVVRTFCDHQKIDKRSVGRWGHPDELLIPTAAADSRPATPTPAASPPIPTTPSDSPPRTGLEGTGLEGTSTSPVPAESAQALALVPSRPAKGGDDVDRVFAAWIDASGRTGRTVFTPERRRLIQRQLKNYPVNDLVDAVRGWRHSTHHRGENDRNTVFNDLELLLRDARHIEMFRDLERDPPGKPLPRGIAGISAWLERTGS